MKTRLILLAIILACVGSLWAQSPATVQGIPPGITLNSSGVLAGNPTTFGVYQFTVQVQDGETPPQTASKQLILTIAPCPLAITTISPLPNGQVGTGYSQQITATCGDGNYTWTVTSAPTK
jgi:hypothetical protein